MTPILYYSIRCARLHCRSNRVPLMIALVASPFSCRNGYNTFLAGLFTQNVREHVAQKDAEHAAHGRWGNQDVGPDVPSVVSMGCA